jgi:CubicO group peptidase (beta-lactamase class C family)
MSGLAGIYTFDQAPTGYCNFYLTTTNLHACADDGSGPAIIPASTSDATYNTVFDYGGLDFQVAGYLAAKLSGYAGSILVHPKPWQNYFNDKLLSPLGLNNYTYDYNPGGGSGTIYNPNVAGGAASDAADYAVILQMILNGGKNSSGTTVLSPSTISALETQQVALVGSGAKSVYTVGSQPVGLPLPVTTASGSCYRADGYSYGFWTIDPALHPGSSSSTELIDVGAYGTSAWIDTTLGFGVILLIDPHNHYTAAEQEAGRTVKIGLDMMEAINPYIIAQITSTTEQDPSCTH